MMMMMMMTTTTAEAIADSSAKKGLQEPRVTIGLIGAGWVARHRHLPALAQMAQVDVHVIWSRHRERAVEAADEFGILHVADRWQDVIDSPAVDAVVVATPPVLHEPATVAALEAGKHVLCQARMARNLREAHSMVDVAKDADCVSALYPPRSGLRGDRTMRRLLHQEKFVGDVNEVRVTGMALVEPRDGYDWRQDPDVVGVNAMTLGMWVEVLNRWLGPAKELVATAQTHRPRRRTVDGQWAAAVVPDSLVVGATLECGATASYHFSNASASGPEHAIEIRGSRGMLVYDLTSDTIHGGDAGDGELRLVKIPAEEQRFQDTDAEFVNAILHGGIVSPDFTEGLQYMAFCEAVAYSVATGNATPVPSAEPLMESWGRLLD